MPAPADHPGDSRSSEDLIEAAVSGVRWMSAARVVAELVGLGTMVVLARLIPPAEFGIFVITLLVQELALSLLGESVGSALIQRPHLRREHVRAAQAICLTLGLAMAGVALLAAEFVFEPIFGSETAGLVRLSVPFFLLIGLATTPQAMLQRRLDFRRVGLIQIASLVVRSAVAVVLAAFAGMDAEALVLGALAGSLIATAIAIGSVTLPAPSFNRRAARELGEYGVPAGIAAISWIGFRNADYAIVGARLGLTATGIYWRAFQLAVEYQRKISTLLYQIGFPLLSRSQSEEGMLAMRFRIMRVLSAIVFPLLAMLAFSAPELIPALFGSAWEEAVVPTQLLVVAGAATLVIDGIGTTMMAAGRPRALLVYGWAHFIVYAAAIVVVAPLGVTAVALAAVATHIVFLIAAYGLLLRGMVASPLRQLAADVGPASVASLALLAVAIACRGGLEAAGAAEAAATLAALGLATVTYALVLRRLFPAGWSDLVTLARRVLPERRSGRRRAAVAGARG
jgi:PST family polysaccharide transporter